MFYGEFVECRGNRINLVILEFFFEERVLWSVLMFRVFSILIFKENFKYF